MSDTKDKPRIKQYPFYVPAAATMGAAIFSNPFEVVKIRMQLQGELQKPGTYSKAYKNVGHGFLTIFKEEGIFGLQKGLMPALMYQASMNGVRLGVYEKIKAVFDSYDDKYTYIHKPIAGATAGCFGAVVGSPFYMAKTRMQAFSTGETHIGTQHEYKNTVDCFRSIYKTQGIRGLWTGVSAAVPRVAVGSAVQLTSYETCKATVLNHGVPDDIRAHVGSSLLASMLLVFAMNPFDVVSTRMYNQPMADGKGLLYSNVFNCFYKIATTEKLYAFYKGTGAHYLRLGPHTVLTFTLWEQFKRLHDRFVEG